MIFDFSFLKDIKIPKFAIIGAGPAGITLSQALAAKGIKNLILEAGGLDFTPEVQETCHGQVIGDEYWALETSRLKYFGGTSNHWSGICRHLDEIDFCERNDIASHLAWPIKKIDLDPYAHSTNQILEVPALRDAEINEYVKEVEFAKSPPVRFGKKYIDLFEKSDNANVCLNSSVISANARGGRISSIEVAGLDGERTNVEIDKVIFCMGGIENSRILLWSNDVSEEPIVENTKMLGKYWFEHPVDTSGEIVGSRRISKFEGPWDVATFAPTPKAMVKFRILNAALRVHGGDRNHHNIFKEIARYVGCRSDLAQDAIEQAVGKNPCRFEVQMVWEQEPREQNRIEISKSEKDKFGIPRPVLFWTKSELDYRTPKVMLELFGSFLADKKNGWLRSYDHIIEATHHPASGWMAGHHHMGGTRMASRPDFGVVNENLKIFGMSNGYILGSSVFPRGGHANPTYTIVQLALRLADHLASTA